MSRLIHITLTLAFPFTLFACSCNRGETHVRAPNTAREGQASSGGTRASLASAQGEDPRDSQDLGELPRELAQLRWPEPPRIARTVRAASANEVQEAVDRAGTRIEVNARIDAPITIHASDIEVLLGPRARIERIVIDRGVHRVRIADGQVNSIELLPPAAWDPDVRYDEDLFVTDVSLENLHMEANDSALVIRGRRVAVIGSDVTAERYSLWAGDTGPLDGEDLIVAHNTFRSAGPESTLRMHDVERSVVVDNVLSNGAKHDYRVHGRSDLAYAARNVLLRTGIMIGTQPEDHVGTVILEDNVLHHEAPSLLEINPAQIRRLVLRNNTVYTNVWDSFYPYPSVESGWVVEGNRRLPFQAWTPPR